ncbi:MAG: thioredoxin domain-containing protein [Anaerolineales bacterium]
MPNHLANETSRYLRQHADNPVDWYPWGQEALDRAQRQNKPVFLSIGYSACHWCHVMAHESFEDEETAALLNEHFVNIKVDREERPDLDGIYMQAVQAMTGRGGWPMSVFLTPQGVPFYGGTYFPAERRYGMPAFKTVLRRIAEAWETERDALLADGERVKAGIEQVGMEEGEGEARLTAEALERSYADLRRSFDADNGGWGAGPKFPQPMALEFLLGYHLETGDTHALHMVTKTLEAMARGGVYDQLGGGFHRYAVDGIWLVPHFEKMLYDNAQLARLYLHAWQVTERSLFRAVVEETLDYVLREMTHPRGGFYATLDADTEGEEGATYLWTPEEIGSVLGPEAERFMAAYGVSEGGNFEGQNILTFQGTMEEREELAAAREKLLDARDDRPQPGRDEKVLVSWNGLMLAALAEAALVLDRDDYRAAAQRNAEFILQKMGTPDGRLYHTWKEGTAAIEGFLADYTHLIEGLLALYQTTFEGKWYEMAKTLMEAVIAHFAAETGFYDTADDAEELITRPQEMQDNALPSGNAMAATVLTKLTHLSEELAYTDRATAALRALQAPIQQHPLGLGQWLIALQLALAPPTAVAIVGDPDAKETRLLLRVVQRGHHPHRLVATGNGPPPPILADRPLVDDQAAAYVCRGGTCRSPVTDAAALEEILTS